MEDIDIIIENYKKWAEKNGFSINPNKKVVEFLVKSLLDREQKFGKRYCPCRRITGNKKEDEQIVCPCIYM
jgi:ferredoxin-thioredoxin reductase catalytic chain